MTTALITGATSGIGLALAKELASHGINVVLVARKQAELAAVSSEIATTFKVATHTILADLSDEKAPAAIVAELKKQQLVIDILVNNAGYAIVGPFVSNDAEREFGVVRLNVLALTELTKLLLPGMVERKRGRILNLGSTAAFQPGPFMAVYYASKAYVLSFSEALGEELRGTGVTVTCLCPGPTKTGFQKQSGRTDIPLFKARMMDPADVAAIAYRGLIRGKRIVIPGFLNGFGAFASKRLAPDGLILRIVRGLQE